MDIERTHAGATITIDENTANEWALDHYNIDTEDIAQELRDLGYGLSWYEVQAQVDVSINFTVRVKAGSEDEAHDLVLDSSEVDENAVSDAVTCDSFDEEIDFKGADCEVGCVEINLIRDDD